MSIDATNGLQHLHGSIGLQNLLGSIYKIPVVCIIMRIDTAHGLQNLLGSILLSLDWILFI